MFSLGDQERHRGKPGWREDGVRDPGDPQEHDQRQVVDRGVDAHPHHDGADHHHRLADQDHAPAVQAVGHRSGEKAQEEDRDPADQVDETDERIAAYVPDEPENGGQLQPAADARDEGAGPVHPEAW